LTDRQKETLIPTLPSLPPSLPSSLPPSPRWKNSRRTARLA
jgi:hypothetical protein